MRKTLNFTVLRHRYDILYFKNDVMYLQKVIRKKLIFCFVGALKITDEKSRIRYSEVRGRSGTLVLQSGFGCGTPPIMMQLGIMFRIASPRSRKKTVGYRMYWAALRIRIRDRVLFDPWFRDPGSGIGFFRIPDLGSRIPYPKTIFLRAF